MAEHIACEGKQGLRVGRMGHDLPGFRGLQFAQLNSGCGVCGGIDKNDPGGARNRFGQFGCELMAGDRADTGKFQSFESGSDPGSDAVVAAKLVAVTDHEQAVAVGILIGICHEQKLWRERP